MLVRERHTPKVFVARGGYTLMEMLVVVAIIVVLAGIGGYLLLPNCLLYTSPSPRDISGSRMPSSA